MATKKINGFMMELMPYSEIRDLDSGERIRKILSIVLNNKIIILQGKLRAEEEARLIEDTMAMIDHVKGFKGIELAVISANGNGYSPIFSKLKNGVARMLVGDTASITIIGPASIVKDIKRNPKKIELMLRR